MYVFFGTGTGHGGDDTVRVAQARIHIVRPADLDGDDEVGLTDFAILANNWFNSNCQPPEWCGFADMDHSSSVGIKDLDTLGQDWLYGK